MLGIQPQIVQPRVWSIYWLCYPAIHLWGLRKTTNSSVGMVSIPTKMWTWHLLNTSQKHHHFTQFIQYIWGNIQNATHQEEQTYQLENLSVAVHQSEIYVWSQDRNHFCAALSEIHTLLSAYNTQAWNLSKNALNNIKGKIHLRTDHEAQNGSNALSLTSVLDGGGWSTPHPARFTNQKETLHPLYRTLGGTQDGLDGCQKSPPNQD
jgi:hypothetical protein